MTYETRKQLQKRKKQRRDERNERQLQERKEQQLRAWQRQQQKGQGGPAERRGDTAPQPWQPGRSGFM